MPFRRRTLRILLSCSAVLAAPWFAIAAAIPNPIGSKTFEQLIQNIITFVNAMAAGLTALMILIAGYLYLFSGGSEDKIKQAHRALTWAVVGFVVILFSSVAAAIIRDILD